DRRIEPQVQQHLEAIGADYEPWDGPAALVFSDGRVVGAKLDRNGLRPLRYSRTSDGWIVAGSEAGIVDFASEEIVERQRLGPGEMLMVDISSGAVIRNRDLLRCISNEEALRPRRLENVNVAPIWGSDATVAEPERIAAAVGWSEDQVRFLLH